MDLRPKTGKTSMPELRASSLTHQISISGFNRGLKAGIPSEIWPHDLFTIRKLPTFYTNKWWVVFKSMVFAFGLSLMIAIMLYMYRFITVSQLKHCASVICMSYGCSNITLLTRMYRLFGKYVSFMSNLFETTWLSLEKKGIWSYWSFKL